MDLWKKWRDREPVQEFLQEELDPALLDSVLRYAGRLTLPDASASLAYRLAGQPGQDGRKNGAAPYYLVLSTPGKDFFSLGYAAGQLALFLRFLGLAARILRELPPSLRTEAERGRCSAALAFGAAVPDGERRKKTAAPSERPCVCREFANNWDAEVLSDARTKLRVSAGAARVLCRDGCIHFMAGATPARKMAAAQFETGIALANVMAAGEELWIDLRIVHVDGMEAARPQHQRYMASVCRREDAAAFEAAGGKLAALR